MATAKKVATTPPKKAVATTPVKRAIQREQEFSMPMEVKDWIDQAMSRLKNLQSKVDRLEAENKELKSYKRWAEHRILNSSPE
jgi:predicted RNase H-like nuclease (RuvC/YqgF family)